MYFFQGFMKIYLFSRKVINFRENFNLSLCGGSLEH